MDPETDSEVSDLIKQQQQMQVAAEVVASRQLDLKDQLEVAEKKALEQHQKHVEEKCDVGGEG